MVAKPATADKSATADVVINHSITSATADMSESAAADGRESANYHRTSSGGGGFRLPAPPLPFSGTWNWA